MTISSCEILQCVYHQNYIQITANQLKKGMFLMAGLSISEVYFVYKFNKNQLMYKITTKYGPIIVSREHFLYDENGKKAAKYFKIGDNLLTTNNKYTPILAIEYTISKPVFVLTKNGRIAINNIVISCNSDGSEFAHAIWHLYKISKLLASQSLYTPISSHFY